jgi:glycosyltransferase involved in cell wall biosynthesis
MVKLLHIGITAGEGKWLSKAFAQMTSYAEIKPKEPVDKIRNLYDSHKPDIVFMQIQESLPQLLPLVKRMSKECLVINWSGDVRDPLPKWYFDFDPYCVTCFSNMRDVKAIGGEYLQIGFDAEIFKRYKNTKGADIVFMANRSACFPLSGYRHEIVDNLRSFYGHRFKIIGGWPNCDGNLMYRQDEEAKFYSGSKIAISVSHFDISRYFSDRLIRSMASGCFTLSHHYVDIEKDFEAGKHLDTFTSIPDLKRKIDFYLERDAQRQLIARQGYEYVHKTFTTRHMVNNILKIYDKHKILKTCLI